MRQKLFRFKMNVALNVPQLPDVEIKFKNSRCAVASIESLRHSGRAS